MSAFLSQASQIELAVVLPLIGGAVVLWLGERNRNLRETASLVTAALEFLLVASLTGDVMAGGRPSVDVFAIIPGVNLTFTVEPLGQLFALVASFLWFATTLYAIGYMRAHHEKNQTRFYVFFAVAISTTIGIAYAGNMLTLFLFYELLTLSTFPLVTHSGTTEARRAGRVYLGILLGTSIAFQLLAIIWTWTLAGTLDFRLGGILQGQAGKTVVGILLALYVFGIGKAALMPFHRWLPSAMVAPTPVSALLHAVAVVKAGVFTILKVTIYIFGVDFLAKSGVSEWLQYVAALTIILASLVAMTKDNLKARLAYSTISQLAYIVLGAMLVNTSGILGGGLHIATHAFGKITLFFAAGAIMIASHKTKVSELDGLGRKMPFTFFAFLIGALSIIGLPPFGGVWSKWYLVLGTLEAGQLTLLGVLLVSTLLNIAYLLPIPFRAFFMPPRNVPSGDPARDHHDHGEAPIAMLLALAITATGCFALFLYPDFLINLLRPLVENAQ